MSKNRNAVNRKVLERGTLSGPRFIPYGGGGSTTIINQMPNNPMPSDIINNIYSRDMILKDLKNEAEALKNQHHDMKTHIDNALKSAVTSFSKFGGWSGNSSGGSDPDYPYYKPMSIDTVIPSTNNDISMIDANNMPLNMKLPGSSVADEVPDEAPDVEITPTPPHSVHSITTTIKKDDFLRKSRI